MAAQAESVQTENVAICDRCDYVGTITTGTCCERCTAELPTKATRSVVCFRCKNIWKRLYECKVTGDESCAMCFAEMHSCKLCGSHIDGKHHPREDLCNQCRSVEIAIDSFLEDGEEQESTEGALTARVNLSMFSCLTGCDCHDSQCHLSSADSIIDMIEKQEITRRHNWKQREVASSNVLRYEAKKDPCSAYPGFTLSRIHTEAPGVQNQLQAPRRIHLSTFPYISVSVLLTKC